MTSLPCHPGHCCLRRYWLSCCILLLLWRPARLVESTEDVASGYSYQDNLLWAITSKDMPSPYHKAIYEEFMNGCNAASDNDCQIGEDYRLDRNIHLPPSVYNYTKTGYAKLPVPEHLWSLVHDFWQRNKNEQVIEWKEINPFHNMWDVPSYFVNVENRTLDGGPGFQRTIWMAARPILEEWSGQRLIPSSMYGIRVYKEGSILTPHVDKLPLVISCIINVDQDVDESWPLEVFDHEGKAHNITIEPGEMILYESSTVIHGRPVPLKGRMYSNVFVHFEPIGPLDMVDDPRDRCGGPIHDLEIPPYLIRGSVWEQKQWRWEYPDGWTLFRDLGRAIMLGDIRILECIRQQNPEWLTQKDSNGWSPIHESVMFDHVDVLEYLLQHGASVHDRVGHENDGPNVLENARRIGRPEHDPIVQFLRDRSEL